MRVSAIDRIQLTVSSIEASASFYGALMDLLGLTLIFRDPNMIYWAGRCTAVAIARCADSYGDERFVQERVGLHHVCFRVSARKDVKCVHDLLLRRGAKIIAPPGEWPWAPGYYSVLFEDPDGIQLEVSHARGKGHLDETMTAPIPRPVR